ncbi:MAG: HAD-IIIA family hydrolase [bacterium]|nr:HAD-IIIA family hydrolase [bacterium]
MKIVFLDRDGTIIQDPLDERVDKIEKIELFPDSIEALKYLADNDIGVVLITNQAGISEGRITEDEFWSIHNEVLRQLSASGIKFIKTYMNGEAAGPDATEWRKPGPKMLLQAADDLNLNLKDIYMVGDNESDIQAGINAGCKGSILVKTARNKVVESPEATYSAPNLSDAVQYIVSNS